jgi:hypothetical protein
VAEKASVDFSVMSLRGRERIPFILISMLLTATAFSKLWMLLTDSFADIRVGLPKEILWLSVAFELWLAFENFRLRDLRVIAFINTVVFACFAIFASARWLLGYSSCGCSGKLELPAWLFILIDGGLLASFIATSNQRSRLLSGCRVIVSWWHRSPPEKRGRLAGLIVFGGLIIGLQLPITAPVRAMVLGESAIVAIVEEDEELLLGQQSHGNVELRNRSSQPAKIVGISRSCRCFDLAEDPTSKIIPANGRLVLPLAIKPNTLGPLHQRVELFLDHPKQFRVNIDVIGFVEGVD